MGDVWRSKDGTIELRCGDWRTVLADVERCDAVICDPPYSLDTHSGNSKMGERFSGRADLDGYAWIGAGGVREIVKRWSACDGWTAFMTDHRLSYLWHTVMRAGGRYAFAPVPILQHRPRLGGDGPGSCCVYLQVSRPTTKRFLSWGSLPGWYESQPERNGIVNGAKPLALMRAIVRDYSRPGDLVIDPFAGGATTLLACAIEGRRCIGAELDPKTYAKAVRRLSAGWTVDWTAELPKPQQQGLL